MAFFKLNKRLKILDFLLFIFIFSLLSVFILIFKFVGTPKHAPKLSKFEDLSYLNNKKNAVDTLNNGKYDENFKNKFFKKNNVKKKDKRLGKLFGGKSHLNVYDIFLRAPYRVLYKLDDSILEKNLESTDCLPLNLQKSTFIKNKYEKFTFPLVYICVHPMEIDNLISFELQRDGIWEKEMVGKYIGLLNSNPDLLVYDIGANIGMYSLIAAALGHNVVAVEPVRSNVLRLHQAAILNRFEDKVIVVENAVWNIRKTLELDVPNENQGGGKLGKMDADKFCDDFSMCPLHAETILLNDLLDVTNGKRALIKIDVEGAEHKAMRISKMLFREVEILYIIMEWRELKKYHGSFINDSEDKEMVNEMIEMLTKRGYSVQCLLTGNKLSLEHWYGWPDNVLWVLNKNS